VVHLAVKNGSSYHYNSKENMSSDDVKNIRKWKCFIAKPGVKGIPVHNLVNKNLINYIHAKKNKKPAMVGRNRKRRIDLPSWRKARHT